MTEDTSTTPAFEHYFPPFTKPTVLPWKRLDSLPDWQERIKPGIENDDVMKIAPLIQEVLGSKPWLLDEDVILSLPPTDMLFENEDGSQQGGVFRLSDFCLKVDETAAADVRLCGGASGDNGKGEEQRSLAPEQWRQLKETGELLVPSVLFANQVHTWRLARWFYSGSQTAWLLFRQRLGRALDALLVGIPLAVGAEKKTTGGHSSSEWPSVLRSAQGFVKAADIFGSKIRHWVWGLPAPTKYSEAGVEDILNAAEDAYVTSELLQRSIDVQHGIHDNYDASLFAGSEGSESGQPVNERSGLLQESDRRKSAFWEALVEDAEWGQPLLRIPNNEKRALKKAVLALDRAREDFNEEWLEGRRNGGGVKLPHSARKSPLQARREAARASMELMYHEDQAWLDHLASSSDSTKNIEAHRLLGLREKEKLQQEDEQTIKDQIKKHEAVLRKRNPIFCLSSQWMEINLKQKEDAERKRLGKTHLTRLVERLRSQYDQEAQQMGLHHQATVYEMRHRFESEIRPMLAKRLRRIKVVVPKAEFRMLRLQNQTNVGDRFKNVHVNVQSPFWRIWYYGLLVMKFTKDMIGDAWIFLLRGPLSLRALFGREPFNGETPTLSSRLRAFHQTLRQRRIDFEDAPDTGLLGKGVERPFVRLYLVTISVLGSAAIVGLMTVGTFVGTLASFIVVVCSPILAMAFSLFLSVFHMLVYDYPVSAAFERIESTPFGLRPEVNCWGFLTITLFVSWHVAVTGLLQLTLASLRLMVWHPLVVIYHTSTALFSLVLRSTRNALTWPIVRMHARIPLADSFMAFRVSGPGMASKHYTRLPLTASKEALVRKMAAVRLNAHAQIRTAELCRPIKEYTQFFQALVTPFGISASKNGNANLAEIWTQRVTKKHKNLFKARESSIEYEDAWSKVSHHIRLIPESSTSSHDTPQDFETEARSISELDEIFARGIAAERNGSGVDGADMFQSMYARIAYSEAVMSLQSGERESRLYRSIALPHKNFRLSEVELENLWQFALSLTEEFQMMLREELSRVAGPCSGAELERIVGTTIGDDAVSLAAGWLSELLGGDSLLESLEETDQDLVLEPVAPESKHLVWW